MRLKFYCSLLLLLASQSVLAVSYPLPPEGSRLVGAPLRITVPAGNKLPLEAFAAQYGQGLSNLIEANPGVDVFLPRAGSELIIPRQLILPDTPREGVVVNVAEMRLYYYPPEGNTVEVFPIGIGQAGRETPRSWVTKVERKQEGPTWVPTANTRRAYASEGKSLPAYVPAGPDNPMGLYAIYIGRFNVPEGTRVQLIDQPVKVTTEPDGSRWLEVHEPLSRNRGEFESSNKVPLPSTAALNEAKKGEGIDMLRVTDELERRSGMPVSIGGAATGYAAQ